MRTPAFEKQAHFIMRRGAIGKACLVLCAHAGGLLIPRRRTLKVDRAPWLARPVGVWEGWPVGQSQPESATHSVVPSVKQTDIHSFSVVLYFSKMS